MDGGIVFFLFLVFIIINYILASVMQDTAEAKGYKNKTTFWLCFLLGVFGLFYACALPDLVQQRKLDSIISLLGNNKGNDRVTVGEPAKIVSENKNIDNNAVGLLSITLNKLPFSISNAEAEIADEIVSGLKITIKNADKNITRIIADVFIVTRTNEFFVIRDLIFSSLELMETKELVGRTNGFSFEKSQLDIIGRILINVTQYVIDNDTIETEDSKFNSSEEVFKREKEKQHEENHGTKSIARYIYNNRSIFKSTNDILKMVVEKQENGNSIDPAFVLKIKNLAEVERMYGNSYESTMKYIEQYL